MALRSRGLPGHPSSGGGLASGTQPGVQKSLVTLIGVKVTYLTTHCIRENSGSNADRF